ncbi:MAG TPA: lipid-binding SYLF domain-containing protein [Bryobacteraceae bacterium]|jgi:lipid-binding SYLF domain-containing protein|nr:lipid-binding SYLF domain-containing protein [Bryobacteraceae bacterium]
MKFKSLVLVCLSVGAVYGAETSASRLQTSNEVLGEIMSAPDKGIPRDLLEKSHCIVIVPGLKKGAFIFGGKYGRGYILCRASSGTGWSAPAGVTVEGGSFGFQIGGEETDAVMLVMSKRGAEKLLSSKFTLGGDASVAAGPVGRSSAADTDLQLHAEILTYSRSRGVFAGVSLNGATLRPDKESNNELYRNRRTNQQIVMGRTSPPESSAGLRASLTKYSVREE